MGKVIIENKMVDKVVFDNYNVIIDNEGGEKMAYIKIPADEVLEQVKKVRETAFTLERQAEKLWGMCKATIETESDIANKDDATKN